MKLKQRGAGVGSRSRLAKIKLLADWPVMNGVMNGVLALRCTTRSSCGSHPHDDAIQRNTADALKGQFKKSPEGLFTFPPNG